MATNYDFEDYSSDAPSPPTPDNSPPPTRTARTLVDFIDMLENVGSNGSNAAPRQRTFPFHESGNGGHESTASHSHGGANGLADLFKLITPIIGASTTAAQRGGQAGQAGQLTVKQRKNISHAFAIVECEQHAAKFLRVLSERESALDKITGRQIISIINVVLPEIQPPISVRLAKLLMLALE
jgi:hypothetical protein